jgi:hypothetical protein
MSTIISGPVSRHLAKLLRAPAANIHRKPGLVERSGSSVYGHDAKSTHAGVGQTAHRSRQFAPHQLQRYPKTAGYWAMKSSISFISNP